MSTMEQDRTFTGEAQRAAIPENSFGLGGLDHVGIPTRNPDLAGKFVEQILGGVECYRAGYLPEDLALKRLRHIFYHVGRTIVEVVEVEDGESYPDKTNPFSKNTNPHWAFGTSSAGVGRFVEHLKREGIPFNGPRSHLGASVVSVYFRDLDGNNLEVTTWDDDATEVLDCKLMGGENGFIGWENLGHNWRPR